MAQHHDFKVKNGLVVADSGTFGNTITGTNAVFTGSVTASNILDSADVIAIIGSEGLDSNLVISIVDSAYVKLRDRFQDSGLVTSTVNKAYVDALNIDADTLDGQTGTFYLDYNNFTNVPSSSGLDSAGVISLIDSDYIELRRPPETVFNIVNNGASAYTFTGDGFSSSADNPTLYLTRGKRYKFSVNASGHPLQIRLSSGGTTYNNGVTNNGVQTGTMYFTPDMSAPTSLVYQCTVHGGMVGNIVILDDADAGLDSANVISLIDSDYITQRVDFSAASYGALELTAVTTGSNTATWTFNTNDQAENFRLIFNGLVFPASSTGSIILFEDAAGYTYAPADNYNITSTNYTITATRNNNAVTLSWSRGNFFNATGYPGGFSAAFAAGGGKVDLIRVWSGARSANSQGGQNDPYLLGEQISSGNGFGSNPPIFGVENAATAVYTSVNNVITSTVDSAYVTGRVDFTGNIDSAYVRLRQSYNYNSLINRPEKVSTWSNDAGYITDANLSDYNAVTFVGENPEKTEYWVVPAGVTSISVVAIGGGGGGGEAASGTNGIGGGGGLAYDTALTVTPGETLKIVAGSRGSGGLAPSDPPGSIGTGSAGGTTYLYRGFTVLLQADGGTGASGGTNGTGGDGGTTKGYDGGGDGAVRGAGQYSTNGAASGGASVYGSSDTNYNYGEGGPGQGVGQYGALRIIWGANRSYPNTNITQSFFTIYDSDLGSGGSGSGLDSADVTNLINAGFTARAGNANEIMIVDSTGNDIESTSILSLDTTNNYIGINQSSPQVTLHMTGEGAQTAQIRMEQYNSSADAPDVRTRRYRGTIASPSAIQSGDYLYRSNHEFWNGSALIVGGQFAFDNTNNANRTQFTVAVTTDGTSVEASTNDDVQFKIDGNDSGAITFNNAYKFPTSDGSANQVLQTDGIGNLSFATVAGAGGGGTVDSAYVLSVVDSATLPITQRFYHFTATAGQTTFSGLDDDSDTLAYTAGALAIYLNGILLVDSADYTASNGTSITLTDASVAGDVLTVQRFGGNTIYTGATPFSQTFYHFTATAGQTTFSGLDDDSDTLTYSTGHISVYLNGILLVDSADYTASNGTSIVLTDPAVSGDVLSILKFGGNTLSGIDSAAVINLIDSAYIQARTVAGTDSAAIIQLIDSAYIQARQTDVYRDSAFVDLVIEKHLDLGEFILGGDPGVLQYVDFVSQVAGTNGAVRVGNGLSKTGGTGWTDAAYFSVDSSFVTDVIDSAYINARVSTSVDSAYVASQISASPGGVTVTEVFDDAARLAIASPVEGDVAVQYGSGPGVPTGVTYNFNGAQILSWSPNYNSQSNAEITINNSTLAAAAQPGDVIVLSSAAIQWYSSYSHHHIQPGWVNISSGTFILGIKSVDANTGNITVLIATTTYYSANGANQILNSDLKDYFDNASNPRGLIPSSAVVAYDNLGYNSNTNGRRLTGYTATLYKMFTSNIQSGLDTSAGTNTSSDDVSGNVTALANSNPRIYLFNDSAWNSYFDQQITGTIDSSYLAGYIDSGWITDRYTPTITEIFDSDQRVAITSPLEGDVAVQFRSNAGIYTGISHDFTVSGARSTLWSYTVYARSGNSLTYDFGNGRFQWSNSTFDNEVQKGDVIVVEDGYMSTSPGVISGGVNYQGYYGTFIFVCHTPKIGSAAPYYNIAAHAHVLSPSSIGAVINGNLQSYFANPNNSRGSIPSNAEVPLSYININNSSAGSTLQGTVAKLYRFFDPLTYADGYDNNGTADPYNGSNDATFDVIPNTKPLVYFYNDVPGQGSAFRPYVQDQILGTVDSAYINARIGAGSVEAIVDSAYIQLRDRFQDSAGILAIVDSTYVQARQTNVFNNIHVSGQDSIEANSVNGILTFEAGLGITITTDANTDTVTIAGHAEVDSAFITNIIDSAYIQARQTGSGSGTVDSAQTIALIEATVDSDYIGTKVDFTRGEFVNEKSQYTATAAQTVFNHSSIDPTHLDVYLNGILQVADDDYTASTSAVTFTTGVDSGYSVTIVEKRGRVLTQRGLVENKYYFTTPTPTTTITGGDDNNITLDYSNGFLDVYLNGVLLKDSDDYSTNAGTAVTLVSATDSNDLVTLINRKGVVLTPNVKNYEFTADSAQTLFTGSDINGNTLSYVPGSIQVHLNGITLRNTDFTAINGSSITLTSPSILNDELAISVFSNPGQNMDMYKFTADSGQIIFSGNDLTGASLAYQPGNIQVFMNGLLLNDSDDYTAINGMSVVLTTGADLNDEIKIASFVSNADVIRTNRMLWSAPSGTPVAASAGDRLFIDTSTAKTVTLPPSATMGDEIRIIDVTGNASTNNITVSRNGHNIQGAASDLTINIDRAGIGLVYYNSAQGWVLIEN